MTAFPVTVLTTVRAGSDLGAEVVLGSSGTDKFTVPNSGNTLVLFHATTAASRTATIAATTLVDGNLTVSGRTVAVGASKYNLAGPFPTAIYGTTLNITVDNVLLTVAGAFEKGA